MMRKTKDVSLPIAFFDLFLGSLGVFIILFVMSKQEESQEKAKEAGYTEGVYRITAQWPGDLNNDVDLYVRDSQGRIAYFQAKTQGLMHLEYDDLGLSSDTVTKKNGEKVILYENIENTVLRGTTPGEYIVNVHMYRMASTKPVEVTVTLRRSSDNGIVATEQVTLSREGGEQTAFRFVVDQQGTVASVNRLPFVIVPERKPAPSPFESQPWLPRFPQNWRF